MKPFVADDPDTRKVVYRAFVDGDRRGSRDRRPDHAAMQHPRHLDVGDIVELAEHFGWDIETGRRLADDLVGSGRFGLRPAFGDQIVADLAVPGHRQIEIAAADQLAIAELARGIAGDRDDPVCWTRPRCVTDRVPRPAG